ncbi:MAG: hypothetical protein AAFW84_15490 [Cyanobacteria bacterium J06635_15]
MLNRMKDSPTVVIHPIQNEADYSNPRASSGKTASGYNTQVNLYCNPQQVVHWWSAPLPLF